MSLTDQEFMRYNRHVMLDKVGEQGQIAFKQAKVLVVGMGGLGCPVSQYLVASGIGHLTIVDHDVVELSNLQRQILYSANDVGQSKALTAMQRLSTLNPLCNIRAINDSIFDIDFIKLLSDIDVVLDCTDSLKTRTFINEQCVKTKVALVSASAIQGAGQLVSFDFSKSDSPCYQCIFSAMAQPKLNCSTAGVFSPLLGVMGAMQAAHCLNMLLAESDKSLPDFTRHNRLYLFDAWGNTLNQFSVKKDPECSCCGV
ncbi:MAG: HesA/MoeB/ThiF family protein [Gammaproteobacteria bacterium]|nr:HesA/MoeB/ThiF family protein [Gammaproteobacteria bacterium]